MRHLGWIILFSVLTGLGFATSLSDVMAATARIEVFTDSGSLKSKGTGFVVSRNGLIVSNHHVLDGASSVLITLENGKVFHQVTIEDFDEHKDLVLLKVEAKDLPSLPFGSSISVNAGDPVWVIGNTLGEYSNSVSQGVISGIRHNEAGFKYLQFTAPISPGNSGGPLLNQDFEVIGVATATRVDGQNVNFAIPVNYVLGMLENRRGLDLASYRSLSGKGSVQLVRQERSANLVHPDTDISRRVVIAPFDVHTESGGTGREEMFQALVLRLKEMFPEERIVVVEAPLVQEVIRELGRDAYDSIVKPLETHELKQIAVRLRANSVIFGTINSFMRQYESLFLPYVGDMSGWKTKYNVDVSLYKLDRNEILFTTNVRKSVGDVPVQHAANDISSKFYSRLKKEYQGLAGTNLYGDRPVLLKPVGDDFRLLPKDPSESVASREPSRREELLERLRQLSGTAK